MLVPIRAANEQHGQRADFGIDKTGTSGGTWLCPPEVIACRNSLLENLPTGRYLGYGPKERRVFPKAEKAIIPYAQNGLASERRAMGY